MFEVPLYLYTGCQKYRCCYRFFETTVEKLLRVYGDSTQFCGVETVIKIWYNTNPDQLPTWCKRLEGSGFRLAGFGLRV